MSDVERRHVALDRPPRYLAYISRPTPFPKNFQLGSTSTRRPPVAIGLDRPNNVISQHLIGKPTLSEDVTVAISPPQGWWPGRSGEAETRAAPYRSLFSIGLRAPAPPASLTGLTGQLGKILEITASDCLSCSDEDVENMGQPCC